LGVELLCTNLQRGKAVPDCFPRSRNARRWDSKPILIIVTQQQFIIKTFGLIGDITPVQSRLFQRMTLTFKLKEAYDTALILPNHPCKITSNMTVRKKLLMQH